MTITSGNKCPEFEIAHHLEGVAKLSDYNNKVLIIAFHPFSFTGGWTVQVDGFRQHWENLQKMNVELIEVSCDSIPTQKAFSESLGGIPFPMGSDFHPRGFISRQFGVYNEEKGNSKRSVFIIDKKGTINFSKEYEPGSLPKIEDLKEILEKLI